MEIENLKRYIAESGIKNKKIAEHLRITKEHLSNVLKSGVVSDRNGLKKRINALLEGKKY